MEENRRFSWSDLFIKVIIVIIFVLFTVWLLSLSNKGLSNSLDVLTDNIFSENIEKMKEAGKGYFTNERLPQKIGDIKTITLEKMYEKKLLLELKDKFGNACNAKDSYVSIEKMDTEYQMKVSLECGEQEDYVIVIMGCYDYCDSDICEKEEIEEKEIEYEYKKTTGGKWTDYGKWSEWSKVAITKNNYRQVETKVEKENYSYDKTITETVFASFNASCPEGYKETANGTECYKEVSKTDTKNPTCPTVSGYKLTSQDGFNCSYSKTTTDTKNPVCPTVSGYELTKQNGFECKYSKTTTSTASLVCPTVSGYTFNGINGTTCNYSKSTTKTAEPICPTVANYSYTGRNGFTCNYSGSYRVAVGKHLVSTCSGCAAEWQTIYETRYRTTTKTASCPSGYNQSGNSCVKSGISSTTKTASCPNGYNNVNGTCTKSITDNINKTASCPNGYNNVNGTCTKNIVDNINKTASCPSGYNKSGNGCTKTITNKEYANIINSCPAGYTESTDGTKCYKDIPSTVKVTGTKEVTYYRYRVREYVGGTTDYKWSTSKEDKKLLDAGYKLTGRTR